MELDKDFNWIRKNCTKVLPPQMFENIESGHLLICFVNSKAIIMDDQDMLKAYLGFWNALKTWWSISGAKLGNKYEN